MEDLVVHTSHLNCYLQDVVFEAYWEKGDNLLVGALLEGSQVGGCWAQIWVQTNTPYCSPLPLLAVFWL